MDVNSWRNDRLPLRLPLSVAPRVAREPMGSKRLANFFNLLSLLLLLLLVLLFVWSECGWLGERCSRKYGGCGGGGGGGDLRRN